MEKTEITKEAWEMAQQMPKEDKAFVLGFMHGVSARVGDKNDERRRDLQKAD